jgi:hypothetical protein
MQAESSSNSAAPDHPGLAKEMSGHRVSEEDVIELIAIDILTTVYLP